MRLALLERVQFIQALDEEQVQLLHNRDGVEIPPDHIVSQILSTFDFSSPVIID